MRTKQIRKQKRFLLVDEVAERFGKTGPAIRYWIDQGWIAATYQTGSSGRKSSVRISIEEMKRMEKILAIGLPPSAAGLEGFKVLAN